LREATAISQPAKQEDGRQFVTKTIVEQTRHTHRWRTLPRALVRKKDVIGGVAESELVQKMSGKIRSQPDHKADAWVLNSRLNRGESLCTGEGSCVHQLHRVMDKPEHAAPAAIKVMVNPDQLFPPV